MKLYGTNNFSSLWVKNNTKYKSCILGNLNADEKYNLYLINGLQNLTRNLDFLQWYKGKAILFDIDENLIKANCHIITKLSDLKKDIESWQGISNNDIVQNAISMAIKGSFLSSFNKILYRQSISKEERSWIQIKVLNYLFINHNLKNLLKDLEKYKSKRGSGAQSFNTFIVNLSNKHLLEICKKAKQEKWKEVEQLCDKYDIKIFEIRYLYKIWEIQTRTI